VISAARRRALTAADGRREDQIPGVLLTRAGKEVLVDGYELRMLQRTADSLPGALRQHA